MAATSAIFKGLYTKLLTAGGLKLEVGQKLWYTDDAADGRILVSDSGGQLVLTNLITGGTLTGATQGSVLFAGFGGVMAQDNTSLNFDDATDILTAANMTVTSMLATGGLKLGIRSISAAPTITTADCTFLCDATAASFSVVLPAAATNSGRVFNIKKIDATANTVTIDGNASETIDGALTYAINEQYRSIQLQSNGSNWYVI